MFSLAHLSANEVNKRVESFEYDEVYSLVSTVDVHRSTPKQLQVQICFQSTGTPVLDIEGKATLAPLNDLRKKTHYDVTGYYDEADSSGMLNLDNAQTKEERIEYSFIATAEGNLMIADKVDFAGICIPADI